MIKPDENEENDDKKENHLIFKQILSTCTIRIHGAQWEEYARQYWGEPVNKTLLVRKGEMIKYERKLCVNCLCNIYTFTQLLTKFTKINRRSDFT